MKATMISKTTMKEKRQIIQIAVDPANNVDLSSKLYALCNDGTVWFRYCEAMKQKNLWQRLTDEIPQT